MRIDPAPRRVLRTALRSLSLLLALAFLLLWPTSYFVGHRLIYSITRGDAHDYEVQYYFVGSDDGVLLLSHETAHIFFRYLSPSDPGQFYPGSHIRFFSREPWLIAVRNPGPLNVGPFGTDNYYQSIKLDDESQSIRHRSVRAPHWFPALLLSLPGALHLFRSLCARYRNRAGLCPTCGYDLRATPTQCPECGTRPASPAPVPL